MSLIIQLYDTLIVIHSQPYELDGCVKDDEAHSGQNINLIAFTINDLKPAPAAVVTPSITVSCFLYLL